MRAIALALSLLAVPSRVLAADHPVQVAASASLRQSIVHQAPRMMNYSAGVQPQSTPWRSWVARHPIALGMLIGLAGGMAVGASQPYEGKKHFGPFIGLGAGVGVGIGAGTGALISLAGR
jgi:hypothetical protein